MRRRPTLPHPSECSTIGAVGLSFRVRDGTGRFPHAITTANLPPPHTAVRVETCSRTYHPPPPDHPEGDSVVVGRCCSKTVQWTRNTLLFTPPKKGAARHVVCVKIIGLLVLVSSTSRQSSLPHPAYQPSSLLGASPPQKGEGNLISKQASRLDAFSGYLSRT